MAGPFLNIDLDNSRRGEKFSAEAEKYDGLGDVTRFCGGRGLTLSQDNRRQHERKQDVSGYHVPSPGHHDRRPADFRYFITLCLSLRRTSA